MAEPRGDGDGRGRRTSRAVRELRSAPRSPCPHCGRETKTTSDGLCADCWGSKGGRPMGWRKEAPYDDLAPDLDDLVNTGCLPWPLFALALAATVVTRWI